MTRTTSFWRLWGLPDARLDGIATVATAMLLGWSRFANLANGPWEWDEIAFARGVYRFDIAAYFPHPPGYPGWIAIGRLLTPVFGQPLVALQVASAAFAVAALWILSGLGRRVAHPAVATSAALLVLAAPGPWLYSVRGFTTTSASVLALAAALVACGGIEGRRLTAFTLLVSAAFLVRPNMLPPLAVLWLAVAVTARPLSRLLPGVAIGAGAGGIAVALMAWAQGGWGVFIAPFLSHSERHFSRLVGNVGSFADLGLVKGLGGTIFAALLLAAVAVGMVVWARRRGLRQAAVWVVVLAVAIAQLVWMQNRTYCRYAVGAQLALAPLVAGAVSVAPPAVGALGLLAAAGWLGTSSLPLVREQHRTQLAGWRAIQDAEARAADCGMTVVVESELHLFASYLWHFEERHGRTTPPKVLSPRTPEPWAGFDRPYLLATVHEHLYPPSLTGGRRCFEGVSPELEPLTQQRFLKAWVLDNPPLPVGRWWPRSTLPDGRYFLWGGADAQLWTAPVPAGTFVGIEVRPAPGESPLIVGLNGCEATEIPGRSEARWVWFRRGPAEEELPAVFSMSRVRGYPPGNGDDRPLAFQLTGVRVRAPGEDFGGEVASASQRGALGLEVEGCYGAEKFGDGTSGTWLFPESRLRLAVGEAGVVTVRLLSPRPTPSRVRILVEGRPAVDRIEFAAGAADIRLAVTPGDVADGELIIDVLSDAFVPFEAGGGEDRRRLGVVLSRLDFDSAAQRVEGWWNGVAEN